MEELMWIIIRSTGIAGFMLLYATVMLGLTSAVFKVKKRKMIIPLQLHEQLSYWAFGLITVHMLMLLIDTYMQFTVAELLIPFASDELTGGTALGVLAFYALVITLLSSIYKKTIGIRTWRLLHTLNPLLYLAALGHWVLTGTDVSLAWIAALNILPFILIGGMLALVPVKQPKRIATQRKTAL